MFIVFEGIDGAGKGTQMFKCMHYLIEKIGQENVVMTKEPGGTSLGDGIYKLLFNDVGTKGLAPGVVDCMFLAAHLQNVADVVKPALRSGQAVISDRWWYSQHAYMTQRTVPTPIRDAYIKSANLRANLCLLFTGNVQALLTRAQERTTETHQASKAWNNVQTMERIQDAYIAEFLKTDRYPEFTEIRVEPDMSIDYVWEQKVRPAVDKLLLTWTGE